MANFNQPHTKVIDPFNSANICFSRFIGRNYYWGLSGDNTLGMIPCLPKDHPVDTKFICAKYPAPYQHPNNPPAGGDSRGPFDASDSYPFWTPNQNWGRDLRTNHPHAQNIGGYPGTLKYVFSYSFSDAVSDEGGILGTTGGKGKALVVVPGIVNTFATVSSEARELCTDYYKEYTKEEFKLYDDNGRGDFGSSTNFWEYMFGDIQCEPLSNICYGPGIPCIIHDQTHPDYLEGCSKKDSSGNYHKCSGPPDDTGSNCEARYICGQTTELSKSPVSSQNVCPMFLVETLCDGWTSPNGPPPPCEPDSGALCSGDYNDNYCQYITRDITHKNSKSPNEQEGRDNAFLFYPPVHVSYDEEPTPGIVNPCSGEHYAESCCLWSENDLGEFAVSGKNWLPSLSIGEGSPEGALGWGHHALDLSHSLYKKEMDPDCNPTWGLLPRSKRQLLQLPHIKYNGLCRWYGCDKDSNTSTYICEIMTKKECDAWDGQTKMIDDRLEVVGRKKTWLYEWHHDNTMPHTSTPATCECPGGNQEDCLFGDEVVCITDSDAKCYKTPCAETFRDSKLPKPPLLAESLRGKMICIENMVQDPEYTKQFWKNSSDEILERGIFVYNELFDQPSGPTSCENLKDFYNTKYYGTSSDNQCQWANNNNIYNFTKCIKTSVGESQSENYPSNIGVGVGSNTTCSVQNILDGKCCTCFREWNLWSSGYLERNKFKNACEHMNGVYRQNSRCPHGPNQTYLKSKYKNDIKLEAYKTHCRIHENPMAGPMSCKWEDHAKTHPEWTCPSIMASGLAYFSSNYPREDCSAIGGQVINYSPPLFNGQISELAAGNNFSIALKNTNIFTDSTISNIVPWGTNGISSLYNIPNILASSVSVSNSHVLAIQKDTKYVYSWGNNNHGETDVPVVNDNPIRAIAIAASSGWSISGSGFSVIINESNQIQVWGTNGFSPDHEYSIEKVPNANNCTHIVVGDLFAYAICNEIVYGWGYGASGSLGVGTTGANQIACIPISSQNDPVDKHLYVLKKVVIGAKEVSRVFHYTSEDSSLYNPPEKISEIGPDNTIDIKQIVAGHFHLLALDSNGVVYAWGDNRYKQCNILEAKTGTGCSIPDENNGCGITNNYKLISGGKEHSIAVSDLTLNVASDQIVGWGSFGSTDQSQLYIDKICNHFTGYTLESGITLDEGGCGLCVKNDDVWEFKDQYTIFKNTWATPGNPFDPVGYLGLHTLLIWENTCAKDITGIAEAHKNFNNTYIFSDTNGTISKLPGLSTRSSGGDGHCRSHIGEQRWNQIWPFDEANCVQPGHDFLTGPYPHPIPTINTKETTYSGPCWPCPQLYDSLGTEEEMYEATHGKEGIAGNFDGSYKLQIELSGGSAWQPCVWGYMRCHTGGIWTQEWNTGKGGLALDFQSRDLDVTGTQTSGCCSPSSPGYYDQVQITDPFDIINACPDLPVGEECWRCPAWKLQFNPTMPNSRAWDGLASNSKYYNFAVQWSKNFRPADPTNLPEGSIHLPWVSNCTIMEPAGEIPSFIGITSPPESPAAGRTMCWCQAVTTHPSSNPQAPGGPNIYTINQSHGGPGCSFDNVCNELVAKSNGYCSEIAWDQQCTTIAKQYCPLCASRQSHQECQNYHALHWCADKYNPNGWTGGKTIGIDIFGCDLNNPYKVLAPEITKCDACVKCDLPLCRHKYNCNLKCPCGTYGIDCQPTCEDAFGSYGPYIKTSCDGSWPGELNIF